MNYQNEQCQSQNEPFQNIGGYQNVVTGTVLAGDIATFPFGSGRMTAEADDVAGMDVRDLAEMDINIYRNLPVAKQGGVDEQRQMEKDLTDMAIGHIKAWTEDDMRLPTDVSTVFPTDATARKHLPLATGFCDYFPRAMVAVAAVSRAGNEQHNPGKPLHWDRSKSGDEADALMRHFLERGKLDSDGLRHSAKCAWRAMALLEKELEASSNAIS